MTVHAPFRFAPVAEQVYFPAWGPLVAHDVPFKDGLCGEIALEIEAKTPLLVGGARRKASENQAGEVRPFQLADDAYAIPSSSVQGMIRSVLEIAAFGRLGPFVFDRRMAMRDLKSRTGREHYQSKMVEVSAGGNRVTPKAKAGWLRKAETGVEIRGCEMARIGIPDLRQLRGAVGGGPGDPLALKSNADERYRWFLHGGGTLDRVVYLEPTDWHPHAQHTAHPVEIWYARAFVNSRPRRARVDATIVLTGKPQDDLGPGHKKLEFVFHTPSRNAASTSSFRYSVAPDLWRDFLLIHEAQPGRPENPNWTFWKGDFERGNPVPVFYLLDDTGRNVATFGTAFMFKMALKLSTHDMLKNSAADHVAAPNDGRMDLPTLIFGAVADQRGERGLKRRASFDFARSTGADGQSVPHGPAILLGPKPSYYPIYVRQPGNRVTGVLDNANWPHAVASPSSRSEPERAHPKLAGVKVWPARGGIVANTAMCPQHLEATHSIQTTVRALPVGTRFRTKMRFHNLRPVELGALLWALSFGRADAWTPNAAIALRHRLGMGKPYGFGEITVRLDAASLAIESNAPPAADWTVPSLVAAFVTHMNGRGTWANSPQVRTLMAVADPARGASLGAEGLSYMMLDTEAHPQVNEFLAARTSGQFLPEYMAPPAPAGAAASNPPSGVAPASALSVGVRVRVGAGDVTGAIVEILADAKPPACRVKLDKGGKVVRYLTKLLNAIP
jgi:CRISPR-associated protein (TIGR03986 family)